MKPSQTLVSDNLHGLHNIYLSRPIWSDSRTACNEAIHLLNVFEQFTYGEYWLTDEEELFLNEFTDYMECI
jgi:hypothetical protein